VPDWAGFVAQDADGVWWAYEAHPNLHDTGWYENEVGRSQRLGASPPVDYRASCHSWPCPVARDKSTTVG
jgi:hypothetical protein